MRRTFLLVSLFLIGTLSTSAAQARRRPPPRPQPSFQWDSRGWTMLGEQTVSGRVDRDRINVGRYEGRFSKLTLVVLDSDLELSDFTIHFGDGTKYEPRVQHYFRENARTRVIDLPPNGGVINRIDLRYRNLPGGGRARVQVWGFKIDGAPGPRPGPRPGPVWDNKGWELLGQQAVNGRVDRDRIRVGRAMGKFSKLMVVVLDSDLEMIEMEVKFRRGQSFRPAIAQYFRESTRTRAIDLPNAYRGGDRTIETIEFRYRNLPGGGSARVQVWGR